MRAKKMEKDLNIAREQNREAEQYIENQMAEKRKNNELKRAKADILLKEYHYQYFFDPDIRSYYGISTILDDLNLD